MCDTLLDWKLACISYSGSQTIIPRAQVGSESVESFSNDDGDSNEDVKKAIGLLRKTITSRFFVHFFTVLARLWRENA